MTVVNLNKARKARRKTEALQAASENRVRFGRTRAQKAVDQAKVRKQVDAVDGARLTAKRD